MKFTLNWLKDFLVTSASLDDIITTLNQIGLEVESVVNPGDALRSFVIVDVLEAKPHPDADKLRVCTVSDGTGTSQIVCGAPNARKGMKAVLGRPGTYVPGADIVLKISKIRGVESHGMMCSARELELGDEHDGILDLPSDATAGTSYAEYAQLDDPVIDIAITPNRQDCLGVYGIARDLAAAGLGELKQLSIPAIAEDETVPSIPVRIERESHNTCPALFGRSFTGVKNGQSPAWMQRRLKAVGARPISTLVDITNYITFAFGRPLHVYDANRLSGGLTVRPAHPGEKLEALDDKSYTAKGGEIAITDASGLIGFGGIIGGQVTGSQLDTDSVFLEVAYFDPVTIAISGRSHGLITDARYRFERGVDPGFLEDGLALASQMILDLCGGKAGIAVKTGTPPSQKRIQSFRPSRVASLGGLTLPSPECIRILTALGFEMETSSTPSSNADIFNVIIPTWRRDIEGEADLVEEVLRIHGYDNIPSIPLPVERDVKAILTRKQQRVRTVRRALASDGLNEAVTWSFMAQEKAALFGGGSECLKIDNPIASDLNTMRPSILPNLIEAGQRNRIRGQSVIALFEIGSQYRDDSETGEDLVAAGIRTGETAPKNWENISRPVSVFDAKRDAMAALEAAGVSVANLQVFEEAPEWYHPTRKGTLRLGPKNILAAFGEIHPKIITALDAAGPIVGFEVYLDAIPTPRRSGPGRPAFTASNLQAVTRDFAFVMDKSAPVAGLQRLIKGADKKLITEILVFDIYEGSGLKDDEKSVAVTVRLEPQDQTFTDDQLDALSRNIILAAQKYGAKLRG